MTIRVGGRDDYLDSRSIEIAKALEGPVSRAEPSDRYSELSK